MHLINYVVPQFSILGQRRILSIIYCSQQRQRGRKNIVAFVDSQYELMNFLRSCSENSVLFEATKLQSRCMKWRHFEALTCAQVGFSRVSFVNSSIPSLIKNFSFILHCLFLQKYFRKFDVFAFDGIQATTWPIYSSHWKHLRENLRGQQTLSQASSFCDRVSNAWEKSVLYVVPYWYSLYSLFWVKIWSNQLPWSIFQPANILLDEHGHVRISDLGLACDFSKKKPHASV